MTPSTRELAWLAGLLEGEGSFGLHRKKDQERAYPIISLGMTDRDVVSQAAGLMGKGLTGPYGGLQGHKPWWNLTIYGAKAVAWMMTLYVLLGERRQARIREVLKYWRELPERSTRRQKLVLGEV